MSGLLNTMLEDKDQKHLLETNKSCLLEIVNFPVNLSFVFWKKQIILGFVKTNDFFMNI